MTAREEIKMLEELWAIDDAVPSSPEDVLRKNPELDVRHMPDGSMVLTDKRPLEEVNPALARFYREEWGTVADRVERTKKLPRKVYPFIQRD